LGLVTHGCTCSHRTHYLSRRAAPRRPRSTEYFREGSKASRLHSVFRLGTRDMVSVHGPPTLPVQCL
jgi:hypothetical protein